MAATEIGEPILHSNDETTIGMTVGSVTGPVMVLVTNLLVATGTSNDSLKPWDIIYGTTITNHGVLVPFKVPPGVNYLDLWHEFTGTPPTTYPKVRVFGQLPPQGGTPAQSDIDSAFAMRNPLTSQDIGDWVSLCAVEGEYQIKVPSDIQISNGDAVVALNGTTYKSAERTVFLKGCRKGIISVAVAAVGTTKSILCGRFGK